MPTKIFIAGFIWLPDPALLHPMWARCNIVPDFLLQFQSNSKTFRVPCQPRHCPGTFGILWSFPKLLVVVTSLVDLTNSRVDSNNKSPTNNQPTTTPQKMYFPCKPIVLIINLQQSPRHYLKWGQLHHLHQGFLRYLPLSFYIRHPLCRAVATATIDLYYTCLPIPWSASPFSAFSMPTFTW